MNKLELYDYYNKNGQFVDNSYTIQTFLLLLLFRSSIL